MFVDAITIMELTIPNEATSTPEFEQQLIRRCKQGENIALRTLYERHRNDVYRVCVRMIDNEADRDEVLQDIFLQIFRSVGKFKGQSRLKTWIHRIALNVIFQFIRKKSHRVSLQLTDSPPERVNVENSPLSPEEDAISHEKQAAVGRALSSLAPKKRAVLILHDFEGMKAKEIGKVVGTSVMTVRTRLFYAREQFYRLLAEDPAFSDVKLEETLS